MLSESFFSVWFPPPLNGVPCWFSMIPAWLQQLEQLGWAEHLLAPLLGQKVRMQLPRRYKLCKDHPVPEERLILASGYILGVSVLHVHSEVYQLAALAERYKERGK